MKRANYLYGAILEPENLRLAFWKAKKGRSYSSEVLAYQADLEANLADLRSQLETGDVVVGHYRYFKIYDPKERQICASVFCEQVLHHALMNICHEYFDRFQVFDSYACRKGKGAYAAIRRAQEFTAKYPWFLKLDVRKFFERMHHLTLKQQLARRFKEERLLSTFGKIIDSHTAFPGRGVPIGNLTSQYFANHYLAGLDHFIKEKMQIKAYVRYMDDMVLWGYDKAQLKGAHLKIKAFVEQRLQSVLKPEVINRTRFGLPFLGYRILPDHLRLLQRSKRRFIRKMKIIESKYHSGEWDEATCQRHAQPLLAFILHADTKKLRENVILGN